ncbi:hypothetical protein BC834DRAFT_428813 [Gloeopeniophorella convolvens]|nr:hypothetical protein BC834DRAFT_428813 [Gloeopeniophorella convolvens]
MVECPGNQAPSGGAQLGQERASGGGRIGASFLVMIIMSAAINAIGRAEELRAPRASSGDGARSPAATRSPYCDWSFHRAPRLVLGERDVRHALLHAININLPEAWRVSGCVSPLVTMLSWGAALGTSCGVPKSRYRMYMCSRCGERWKGLKRKRVPLPGNRDGKAVSAASVYPPWPPPTVDRTATAGGQDTIASTSPPSPQNVYAGPSSNARLLPCEKGNASDSSLGHTLAPVSSTSLRAQPVRAADHPALPCPRGAPSQRRRESGTRVCPCPSVFDFAVAASARQPFHRR